MTARVAPFPWYGGKARLAPHIVPMLPPHTVYCEPFGGAASVLFAKTPAPLVVYNDRHRGLVSFFRVLRDQPVELERVLRLTPYARDEYVVDVDSWSDPELDDLERARRWFVAAWQSFGATPGRGWAYQRNARDDESPIGTGRVRARSFVSAVDRLPEFAERFRGVQVDCRDWREVMRLYEGRGALFYLDPPYHPDVRSNTGEYAHELTAQDHAELAELAVLVEGSVIVSGYDHKTYRTLEGEGFQRVEIPHYKMASTRAGKPRDRVTEILWCRIVDRSEQLEMAS